VLDLTGGQRISTGGPVLGGDARLDLLGKVYKALDEFISDELVKSS